MDVLAKMISDVSGNPGINGECASNSCSSESLDDTLPKTPADLGLNRECLMSRSSSVDDVLSPSALFLQPEPNISYPGGVVGGCFSYIRLLNNRFTAMTEPLSDAIQIAIAMQYLPTLVVSAVLKIGIHIGVHAWTSFCQNVRDVCSTMIKTICDAHVPLIADPEPAEFTYRRRQLEYNRWVSKASASVLNRPMWPPWNHSLPDAV